MGVKNLGRKGVKNNSLFEALPSLELFRLSGLNLAQVRRPSFLVLFGNEKRTNNKAGNAIQSIDLPRPVITVVEQETNKSCHHCRAHV